MALAYAAQGLKSADPTVAFDLSIATSMRRSKRRCAKQMCECEHAVRSVSNIQRMVRELDAILIDLQDNNRWITHHDEDALVNAEEAFAMMLAELEISLKIPEENSICETIQERLARRVVAPEHHPVHVRPASPVRTRAAAKRSRPCGQQATARIKIAKIMFIATRAEATFSCIQVLIISWFPVYWRLGSVYGLVEALIFAY